MLSQKNADLVGSAVCKPLRQPDPFPDDAVMLPPIATIPRFLSFLNISMPSAPKLPEFHQISFPPLPVALRQSVLRSPASRSAQPSRPPLSHTGAAVRDRAIAGSPPARMPAHRRPE